ncbi:MAG: hypothetical protein ABL986_24525 [Vicinamibacterales bacterium]
MGTPVSIEVDRATADGLAMRAAELGVTVPELLAELAAIAGVPRMADAAEIAELDRRAAAATPSARIPHSDVVAWLQTWGTAQFRPWQTR